MNRIQLRFPKGFKVVAGNARAQAATMVIAPGDREGGADNRHRGADQWLYVVEGTGGATVRGKRHALRPGTLLLIAAGDTHEIRASGNGPLRTLNLYVPPAYTADGDESPRGKS